MFLDLGQMRRNYAKRIDGEAVFVGKVGRASVMVEWSWRIERPRSILAGSFSEDDWIDTAIAGLPGPRIKEITLEGRLPEIRVQLENGVAVASYMTAEGQPVWTLFLPDGSWINVDRGRLIHDTQNQRRGATHRAVSREACLRHR